MKIRTLRTWAVLLERWKARQAVNPSPVESAGKKRRQIVNQTPAEAQKPRGMVPTKDLPGVRKPERTSDPTTVNTDLDKPGASSTSA